MGIEPHSQLAMVFPSVFCHPSQRLDRGREAVHVDGNELCPNGNFQLQRNINPDPGIRL